ncbi:MAG: hypothetical protein M3A44_05720 [Gammaproteobacteria bacterium]
MTMLHRVLFWLLIFVTAPLESATVVVAPDTVPYGRAAEVMVTANGAVSPGSRFVLEPGGPFVTQELPLKYKVRDMALRDGLVYLAAGEQGLRIIDAGMPGAPKLVGHFSANPAVRIVVDSGLALITDGATALEMVDVSDASHPKAVGHYRSDRPITDVFVDGGYAYLLLDKASVAVLDIRSPENAVVLSRYALEGEAGKLFVAGDRVYVANGARGLTALDASDKSQLKPAGRYAVTGGAMNVAVQDGLALVARGVGGLGVFDVSDPARVTWLGSHSRLGNVTGLKIQGRQALVWNDRAELMLLDIAKPAMPVIIASYRTTYNVASAELNGGEVIAATPSALQVLDFSGVPPQFSNENMDVGQGVNFGGERRLFIRDSIAYVSDWFSGLHLYDISDPHRPKLLSTFHTPGSAKGVVVRGDYAFVADDDRGLLVLNIKDPRQPMQVANLPTNGLAYTPKLVGDLLYLASHRGGFQIIDVSNPGAPAIIADVDTPGKAWSLEVAGDVLYVADDASGMLVFDVSDPRRPRQIGTFSPGGAAEDVVVRGDTAYVAFFDQGFYVLDIKNPAELKVLGHTSTPGNARVIELKGALAYVTDWFAGVQVIDISDAHHPAIIGSYDSSGAAWGIGIKGNYAYIGDWWGGFVVLDISNPASPALVGHYHAPSQPQNQVMQVAAQGKFAYTANSATGLQVFDITNHLNPTWATGLDINGTAKAVWLDGPVAYLAVEGGEDEGLVVADIRNPYQTHRIGGMKIVGGAQGVQVYNGRAYVASSRAGLIAMDVKNPGQPQHLAAYPAKLNDVWVDSNRIFIATVDRGLEVLDTVLKPILRYKTDHEFALVRARGDTVFLYEKGVGIHVLDVGVKNVRQIALFETGEELSGITLEDDVLYAAGQQSRLMAVDISSLTQPKIRAIYPLTQRVGKVTLTNNIALLGGADIITAVKLLPSIELTIIGEKKMQAIIPKDMPLGAYNIVQIDRNGGKEISHNALKIEMPRFSKPKITPEEFQRLLQEQKKKLQESAPANQ